MKPDQISQKIENMAHTEFNKEEFKSVSFIENNIKNLKDPFNRNLNLKKTKIDETYPEFIQQNKKMFKDWIL